MAMAAGHKGVARRQPMDETIFQEIIERSVNRDRRRAAAFGIGQKVDHFISAQRLSGGAEQIKDRLATRRQVEPGYIGAMTLALGVVVVVMGSACHTAARGATRLVAINDGH